MSLSSDYNKLLPEIQAMNPGKVVCASMPNYVLAEEIDNLFYWCHDDQIALTQAGFDWNLVTSLPFRTGANRDYENLCSGTKPTACLTITLTTENKKHIL